MDVDELLAGGARRQPPVEVAVPLVRDMRAGSNVRMPSPDVLALKMIGRQAPRWVLQVDVLVPLIQETWNPRGSVCGTPSGHFGDSRDGAHSARVCRGLGRSCAVFKMCTAASLPVGNRGCGEAQLLLHSEMGKVRNMLRDGITMKIVGSFYVVSGVPHCDLKAFSDSGIGCGWSLSGQMENQELLGGSRQNFPLESCALRFTNCCCTIWKTICLSV